MDDILKPDRQEATSISHIE